MACGSRPAESRRETAAPVRRGARADPGPTVPRRAAPAASSLRTGRLSRGTTGPTAAVAAVAVAAVAAPATAPGSTVAASVAEEAAAVEPVSRGRADRAAAARSRSFYTTRHRPSLRAHSPRTTAVWAERAAMEVAEARLGSAARVLRSQTRPAREGLEAWAGLVVRVARDREVQAARAGAYSARRVLRQRSRRPLTALAQAEPEDRAAFTAVEDRPRRAVRPASRERWESRRVRHSRRDGDPSRSRGSVECRIAPHSELVALPPL